MFVGALVFSSLGQLFLAKYEIVLINKWLVNNDATNRWFSMLVKGFFITFVKVDVYWGYAQVVHGARPFSLALSLNSVLCFSLY